MATSDQKKWKTDNKEKSIESDHKYITSERGFIIGVISGIFTRAEKNDKRKKWPPNCTKQDIYDELMLYIQDHDRNCEYCKQPFVLSGMKENGNKQRVRTYCSSVCQDRSNRLKKLWVPQWLYDFYINKKLYYIK